MRSLRFVITFLIAPLVTFPVTLGLFLVMRPWMLPPWSLDDGFLSRGLSVAGGAVYCAYPIMVFLGTPTIFFLRKCGAFRLRSLEVGVASMGGLPFLPNTLGALLDVMALGNPVEWKDFWTKLTWLMVGTISGFFAGRIIWHGASPVPVEKTRSAQPAHAVLTVLYDGRCALCGRARIWLEKQPKYVTMAFVEAGSAEARKRFPDLDHDATLAELTVVGWGGEVYRDAKGWVMCLWALKKYRSAALRLSTPEMMPVARRLIAWVSNQRFQIAEAAGWTR
jgi:predicted DCC family thiol-disulfide oxidoreductase YuxK